MKDKAAVAITGIGGIFPGAPELSDFWNIIRDGVDQSRSTPEGRWILPSEQAVSSLDIPEDGVFTDRGCFIDELNGEWDSLGVSSEIIHQLDPMFHLALAASLRAFQDANLDQMDRSRVGVILGNIALPTETSSKFSEQILGPLFTESIRLHDKWDVGEPIHPVNRLVAGMPVGLVAMALGLGGRCFSLDAACASSLYALKYAADELLSGRADAMLTGGLSRPDCLYTQMGFTQLRALSRRGLCSPFDESGDGLLVGEGAGIVVLKRLADAVEQGDVIYGVIRGIGLSNDVEGNLLSPDSEGQLRAMRKAYEVAGWSPEQVDLIECHGTGTPLGDQVEFRSLKQLWKDYKGSAGSCVLGAVKSNIGHLLTGAGAAGLIKTLLALKNRTLPPIANFEKAHPGLGLEESPFRILKESEAWVPPAQSESRKAAVSAFGFGGINAHVLIEEWVSPSKNSQKVLSRPCISHSESEPIAIVGMDVWAGPWKGLDSIKQRLFGNDDREAEPIESRWWNAQSRLPDLEGLKGYTLESIEIPLKQFRIPPKEVPSILPQQLIMLMVADGALKNLKSKTLDPVNSGVFIGIELDLGTTHFHLRWALYKQARRWAARLGYEFSESDFQAWLKSLRDEIGDPLSADRTLGALGGIVASRLAREFRFGGPCHTVSSEETSGVNALDLACEALRKMELGHALVGAVDMAGDLRSIWGSLQQGRYTQSEEFFPFCEESKGSQPGEVAVALVLKRYSDAQKDGDRVYALLRGIGTSNGGDVLTSGVSLEAGQAAMSRAYERSGVDCRSIDYLDLHGSGIPAEDKVEAKVIRQFFKRPDIE
ncbi:MAG TPA: polyketide synthase, partial [Verrucomicrobia bacterium]|nr:polyketide synthase [Verrucomicrobiota bacterium]